MRSAKGNAWPSSGRPGSGKTTLVQHLNGLLKPTRGRVRVEGVDLAGPAVSRAELRRRVGLVFQYPEHQLFEETVYDDISFVLRQTLGFFPPRNRGKGKKGLPQPGVGL